MFDVFVGALTAVLVLCALSINRQSRAQSEKPEALRPYGLQLRIDARDQVTLLLQISDGKESEAYLLSPSEGCRAVSAEIRYCALADGDEGGRTYYFSAPTKYAGTWSYRVSYYEPPATDPLMIVARITRIASLRDNGRAQVCPSDVVDLPLGGATAPCSVMVARSRPGLMSLPWLRAR